MPDSGPTPFAELDFVLAELVRRARDVLQEQLVGVYLIGSFAHGGFDRFSDVDFVAAIDGDVAPVRVDALQSMHRAIHALEPRWAKHLDGSYVPLEILRRRDPDRTPLLYLDNGSRELVRSSHCNRMVIRWLVREGGIALSGADPVTLVDPVSAEDLREDVRRDMREWAEEIRLDPGSLDSRWHQPYAVVCYCRMLYTLTHGTVVPKPVAAAWAREALDPNWSDLIERAEAARPALADPVRRPADPSDLARTIAFIEDATERAGSTSAAAR